MRPGQTAAIVHLSLGVAGATLLACMPEEAPEIETARQPITGGQVATECQWPTTVLLNGCTGTLVHPLIVTTAAHCGTNHRTAVFGESNGRAVRRVPIEYCRTYTSSRPDGGVQPNTLRDWAFCKLAQPVMDLPIVPILMGCETDILKPGQKVVVAGFGSTEVNQGGFGTKRWVETTVNQMDSGRGIQVGGMGKAPCFGDSGGPAFVKLADGSWRVFGIDSSGLANSCTAGDRMALIHKGVPWIEQLSGLDITPCHDADGKWNPSAGCRAFSLAPDSPGRTWANGCAEPALSGPSVTCGGQGEGEPPPVTPADAAPADAARDPRPAAADAPVADRATSSEEDARASLPQPPPPPRAPDASYPPPATPGPQHVSAGCGCSVGAVADEGGWPGLCLLLLLGCLAFRRRRQPKPDRGSGASAERC